MKRAYLVLLLLASCLASPEIPQENGSIEVLFCDSQDCHAQFSKHAVNASSVQCALYNTDNRFLVMLQQKNTSLVMDERSARPGAIKEYGRGLMHNKFCILGDRVWTGSWNPSQGNTTPNNVVVLQSEVITRAFQAEFEELAKGTFHGGRSQPGKVMLNGQLIEVYFCPEDKCKEHVLRVLQGAKESIRFMTFSFTDDDIGKLVASKHAAGLEVQGIFDKRMSKYSEYEGLKIVAQKASVHHKVFIVDEKVTITGSYNPTKNGDERNDENMVIIHSPQVAAAFTEEFERLFD